MFCLKSASLTFNANQLWPVGFRVQIGIEQSRRRAVCDAQSHLSRGISINSIQIQTQIQTQVQLQIQTQIQLQIQTQIQVCRQGWSSQ